MLFFLGIGMKNVLYKEQTSEGKVGKVIKFLDTVGFHLQYKEEQIARVFLFLFQ